MVHLGRRSTKTHPRATVVLCGAERGICTSYVHVLKRHGTTCSQFINHAGWTNEWGEPTASYKELVEFEKRSFEISKL